jgi:hypothetical protein
MATGTSSEPIPTTDTLTTRAESSSRGRSADHRLRRNAGRRSKSIALAPSKRSGHHALVAADATVEVIGVHRVPDVPSCFLVEAIIHRGTEAPDFALFTQPIADRPRSEWQVAYDEHLLDDDGERVLTDLSIRPPDAWPRQARIAFYFHFLDVRRPLVTPFGEVALVPTTEMPARLSFLNYEAP